MELDTTEGKYEPPVHSVLGIPPSLAQQPCR